MSPAILRKVESVGFAFKPLPNGKLAVG